MRKQGWDVLLGKFVASRLDEPFRWGQHDCTLFAADCVLEISGTDPAAAYRGAYNSETGAARIIAKAGGLRNLVTGQLGPEISPLMAHRGDVVLIEADGAEALAVCMGDRMVAAGPAGLAFRSMSEAITAWRVE